MSIFLSVITCLAFIGLEQAIVDLVDNEKRNKMNIGFDPPRDSEKKLWAKNRETITFQIRACQAKKWYSYCVYFSSRSIVLLLESSQSFLIAANPRKNPRILNNIPKINGWRQNQPREYCCHQRAQTARQQVTVPVSEQNQFKIRLNNLLNISIFSHSGRFSFGFFAKYR